MQVFWLGELVYILQIALCKVILLLFYLRIFDEDRFRRIVWGTICIVTAAAVAYVITCFGFCQPFTYIWTRWDSENKGHCLDEQALAFSHGGINIAFNIFIIGLPISQVTSLRLPPKKKMLVIGMFLIGGLYV
jgi:hypothetical protein